MKINPKNAPGGATKSSFQVSFQITYSHPLAPDASRQLYVLGHDRDALRVDGTQICVLKQSHHVGFSCLLERQYRLRLEAEVVLVLLGDLAHETLEWQLADKQLGRLLELPDFT